MEVRDINNKILEVKEHEIVSFPKVKPFLEKELIQIDLENFHEIVTSAKNQYNLLSRIQSPSAVNNPIKTREVKRANKDFDEVKRVGEILKQSDGPNPGFFLN